MIIISRDTKHHTIYKSNWNYSFINRIIILIIKDSKIPINKLIALGLGLPNKSADGYFRFQCPVCREFNTATNPKTNLRTLDPDASPSI